jgi:predicted hydrocarbon binding protein
MADLTVAFPVGGLRALRIALESLDPDRGAEALREAGRTWADVAERALVRDDDRTLSDLSMQGFWRELSRFLQHAGWGAVEHENLGAIGALRAAVWAESDPAEGRADPGCHFSTGFFGEILSRVAARPVGVMEVECRSKGDPACRFFFGAPAALERLHDALVAGHPLEQALEHVGSRA